MSPGRPFALLVTAVVLAVAASSCCGKMPVEPTEPPPVEPPGPTQPTSQDIAFSGTVPAYDVTSHSFTSNLDGTLNVTLSWANAAVDLDFYLTDGTCTGYPPLDCTILAKSVDEGTTTEQLTRALKVNERYLLWVDNLTLGTGQAYTISGAVRK